MSKFLTAVLAAVFAVVTVSPVAFAQEKKAESKEMKADAKKKATKKKSDTKKKTTTKKKSDSKKMADEKK